MSKAFVVLLSLFVLGRGSLSGDSDCPEVQPQKDFNITSYVTGRWYIQQQMSVLYLPTSQNYCVYAEYKVLDKPTLWGYTIQVHNHAEEKDGKVHDSGNFICAKGTDANVPAKLQVGPPFCLVFRGWSRAHIGFFLTMRPKAMLWSVAGNRASKQKRDAVPDQASMVRASGFSHGNSSVMKLWCKRYVGSQKPWVST